MRSFCRASQKQVQLIDFKNHGRLVMEDGSWLGPKPPMYSLPLTLDYSSPETLTIKDLLASPGNWDASKIEKWFPASKRAEITVRRERKILLLEFF